MCIGEDCSRVKKAMIKLRQNIILQYTLITFAITFSISSLLGFLLSQRLNEQAINAYTNFFPRIVAQIAKENPQACVLLESIQGAEISSQLEDFAAQLQSVGSVYEVKIWDTNGTILWSNKKELVGKNFKDDPDFTLAVRGIANSIFRRQNKDENSLGRFPQSALEIYAPIFFNNKIVGVVEFYEGAQELLARIKQGMFIVWTLIAGAGILLYLLLFFIFYKAHMTQKTSTLKLERTVDVIIYALAYLAEIRDAETGRHLERTAKYVGIIARQLFRSSPYSSYLSQQYIADLMKAAPLHDIGKVGVSDAILHKPGKLIPKEFAEMQKHSAYGADILTEADKKLGFQSLLTIAIQIAHSHHERWDGKGYPRGLSGDNIPLSARIMSLADVYDALRSKRCYKEAYTHAESVKIIQEGKGTQFDPDVVDAFVKREKEFQRISMELPG